MWGCIVFHFMYRTVRSICPGVFGLLFCLFTYLGLSSIALGGLCEIDLGSFIPRLELGSFRSSRYYMIESIRLD